MYWTQQFEHSKEHSLSPRVSSDARSVLDQIHVQEQKVPTRAAYSRDANYQATELWSETYYMHSYSKTCALHYCNNNTPMTGEQSTSTKQDHRPPLQYCTQNSPFVVHHSSNSSCQCLSSIRSPKSKFISIILLPQLSF